MREPHTSADPEPASCSHRKEGANNQGPLRACVCCGGCEHRMGKYERNRAKSPARGCEDGAKENVCHSREGVPRTKFCTRSGRCGVASRRRMVSRERVLLKMAILFVASEAFELKPLGQRLTGCRPLKWPLDYAEEGVWQGRRFLLAANGAGPKLAS